MAFVSGLVALVIGSDLYQFHQLFVVSEVYDPVTANLISADGFIK